MVDGGPRRRGLRALCLVGVPLLLVAGIVAATLSNDDEPKAVEVGPGSTGTTVTGATAPTTPPTSTAPSTPTTPPTSTAPSTPSTPATPSPKKATARVLVKFADGTDLRLRNGSLVSLSGKDMAPLNQVLQRYPGTGIERLFQRPEADLAAEKASVEALTGKPQPDLNLWYVLTPADASKVDALIADLKRLGVVDQANRDPGAAPLPAPAP